MHTVYNNTHKMASALSSLLFIIQAAHPEGKLRLLANTKETGKWWLQLKYVGGKYFFPSQRTAQTEMGVLC